MLTVKLIFNPHLDGSGQCKLFFGKTELRATENKICSFLRNNGFYAALNPVRKKYVIWRGLFEELADEANDSEIELIFEGRGEDFEKLIKALAGAQCQNVKWSLKHIVNFDLDSYMDEFNSIIEEMLSICDSRAEQGEIKKLKDKFNKSCEMDDCAQLICIIGKHIEKWESTNDQYKQSKIAQLNLLKERTANAVYAIEKEKK